MRPVTVGHTLQAHRVPIKDVYFPNGGVFSITNEMRNGGLVEVATVGSEGMLGVGVFFGDRDGIGRTFQQVPNGLLPSMAVARFVKETADHSRRRRRLRSGEPAAGHAVHRVQRAAQCHPALLPWLLQTRDRVDEDTSRSNRNFLR